MKAKLQIAHQVPGRIRMKIPSAKDEPKLLAEIQRSFSAIPGIEEVVINPVTGSVVLKYDAERHDDFHSRFTHHFNEHHADGASAHCRPPSTEIDILASKIQEEADFLAEHSDAAKAVVDFCRHCDRQIKLGSGNTLDLKMALCVGIVGFMIFEIGAAAATPVWVTLSLFGLNHFIEMQSETAKNARADRKKDAGQGHPDDQDQGRPIEPQPRIP
jgi:Heavy metal associated domain 2